MFHVHEGRPYTIRNVRIEGNRMYTEDRLKQVVALKPVTPWWLDVANCRLDPIYDVPGGGRRGTNHVRTTEFVAPQSGRLVFGGGHQHGGGKGLVFPCFLEGGHVLEGEEN